MAFPGGRFVPRTVITNCIPREMRNDMRRIEAVILRRILFRSTAFGAIFTGTTTMRAPAPSRARRTLMFNAWCILYDERPGTGRS